MADNPGGSDKSLYLILIVIAVLAAAGMLAAKRVHHDNEMRVGMLTYSLTSGADHSGWVVNGTFN